MQLDDLLHQRQSDAEAAFNSVERSRALCEQIEYSRYEVGRHAATGVFHAYGDDLTLFVDSDVDAAPGGSVLGGVVQQVDHDLGQASQIPADHQGSLGQ